MKINGKISYDELSQLVYTIKNKIVNTYFKKIYHYKNFWLLKFNNYSFVFEPGICIWPGTFIEREKVIHSVCEKIRKEILNNKIIDMYIFNDDRTLVIEFRNHKLILELYAKGNLILLDKTNTIIVLTRIYPECSHSKLYHLADKYEYSENFKLMDYNKNSEENLISSDTFIHMEDILNNMWNIRNNSQKKKNEKSIKIKKTPYENVSNQIASLDKKMNSKMGIILSKFNVIDFQDVNYKELGKLFEQHKIIKNKYIKASNHLVIMKNSEKKKKCKSVIKNEIILNKWYHRFHWWYTKNKFLVIGGKNKDDNEKIVKTYMNENDFYFHSEDPGSGSFIMITENKIPDAVDIDETAEGVLALSNQWASPYSYGNVFYVKGKQVSKTPPSGEYLTKGSFMINGKKEFVRVYNYCLGYCIYEKQLLFAPYRIINRVNNSNNVKLTPVYDIKKMKVKKIIEALKKTLNIEITENCFILNKPCKIFCK